jgi:hypothetical protein
MTQPDRANEAKYFFLFARSNGYDAAGIHYLSAGKRNALFSQPC